MALLQTVNSTSNLLRQFIVILSSPDSSNANLPPNPPNPLDVLHDAAALLKAQTTKLSLLLINKPFTPSAIRTIITSISSSCLPAMMSAVEICRPDLYGNILHAEAKMRVKVAMQECETMMAEVIEAIRANEADSAGSSRKRAATAPSRDSLASTGVVWAACDSLMALKQTGLVGLIVKKAQQYREMLEDAAKELKEWVEDADAEDDEEDDDDSADDSADGIQDLLEAAHKLPKDRGDLNASLASTFKKLRLTSTLYQALVKRRLKTFPQLAHTEGDTDGKTYRVNVKTLDELMDLLRQIPEEVDDLANAFYELDNDEALRVLGNISTLGKKAARLPTKSWTTEDDEFTTWSGKWVDAMDKL